MDFKIAAQMFSVRDKASEDFQNAIYELNVCGYDGVELAGLYGIEPINVRRILKSFESTPISAHVGIAELEKDDVLEVYAEIGVKYVVIPSTPFEVNRDSVLKAAERITKIGEKCKGYNLKLLFHNHLREFEYLPDTAEPIKGIDLLYKNVPAELLGTEFDTCWVNVAGENPVDFLKQYRDRTSIVHLKDFVGTRENNCSPVPYSYKKEAGLTVPNFEFRPIGGGMLNTREILEACREIGVEWIVVEQDGPTRGKEPMICMKESIKYLRAMEL